MNDDIFTNNIVNDSILVLLVILISILTTIGGVGGGGLLIPVYMLIGKFKIETAIPLTIFTILGDTAMRTTNRLFFMNVTDSTFIQSLGRGITSSNLPLLISNLYKLGRTYF